MLNQVCSDYAELQKEYRSLPLHIRRDIFSPANEKLVYAAAILEPDPKNVWSEISPHGNFEIRPVDHDWYTSIGQLLHDLSQKGVDRFPDEYITSLHTRVHVEVDRSAKVREMVEFIKKSASPKPLAPIDIILEEWNKAMNDIIQGTFVSYAINAAVETARNPANLPGPGLDRPALVHYFELSIDQPLWPSADVLRRPKARPAPRWKTARRASRATAASVARPAPRAPSPVLRYPSGVPPSYLY